MNNKFYVRFTDGETRYLVQIHEFDAEWGVSEQPGATVQLFRNGEAYLRQTSYSALSALEVLLDNWETRESLHHLTKALEVGCYGTMPGQLAVGHLAGLQEQLHNG
ncbi:MAG TPA: hypothetical protein DDY18_11955 [Flavobacterium sp.]|nr:hypothetical protein [Flavobacterium sp.]